MSTAALAAHSLAVGPVSAARPVVEGFDLEIDGGEIVALLGPSGSGKSTLLRALAGLQAPLAGRVSVEGAPLAGVHPRVALAGQDPALLPWLTTERNIAFGLDFRRQPAISARERSARVDWAIREVGLDHARALHPSALSGGMAQRAALARCLARKPKVQLLDEPFGALDEVTRADMQQLLLRVVADTQAATLLVTHDIDEALVVADRILLLGGTPARVRRTWHLEDVRPRDLLGPSLERRRTEILAALRRSLRRPALLDA